MAKSPHSEIFKSRVHNTLGIYLSFEKPSYFLGELIRKVSTGVAVTLNWGREKNFCYLEKAGQINVCKRECLEEKSWSARTREVGIR